ncbi:MAG: glycosyltransferase family 2 protein, partial [Planctomycetales bacterium]|nr:glycosyltransferase family 2 protein [Planctomycetales bacterium]
MPATVSAILVTWNGRERVAGALESLRSQGRGPDEVLVVDNGSRDGTPDLVARDFPEAQLLRNAENRGFAGAVNQAAAAATGEWLVLLNDDARAEPGLVGELLRVGEGTGAACVAARILDETGRLLDFAGGVLNYAGHGWHPGEGLPDPGGHVEGRRLLFACGAALAVRREAFLSSGGFDPDYVAYFEDVDLGWRLNLLGHAVVLAPGAVARHRARSTSSGLALSQRLVLYERNALATITKNYEEATLARALPAALLSLAARTAATGAPLAESFAFGATDPGRLAVPRVALSGAVAMDLYAEALPRLLQRRADLQARRRVADRELFALFGEPLRLHGLAPESDRAAAAIQEAFGIPGLIRGMPVPVPVPVPGPARPEPAPPDSLVSIVILTLEGWPRLRECLLSLRALDWPRERLETVVVDNGSRDGTADRVAREFPEVRLVRNATNLGFAGPNSRAAASARGDLVLFLNDDARLASDALRRLVEASAAPGVAAVSALVLTEDGSRVDFAGGEANFEGKGW